LLDLEELADEDLERIRDDYLRLAAVARQSLRNGECDVEQCDIDPQQLHPAVEANEIEIRKRRPNERKTPI
jgi:hypothetical protein